MRFQFLTIFLILIATLWGQNGIYFHQSYTTEDHNSSLQNWSAAQDKLGRTYFANTSGVLKYNGTDWKLFSVPAAATTSLAIDKDDRIFVGGFKEFGIMDVQEDGDLKFRSLAPDTLKEEIGRVWKTIATPDSGVYFTTFTKIYRYYNNELSIIDPDSTALFLSFRFGNKLFVNDRTHGLKTLNGNKLSTHKDSKKIIGDMVAWGLCPYNAQNFLLLTRAKGLYLLNKNDYSTKPFSKSINKVVENAKPYHLEDIGNDEYALVTNLKGTLIINKSGEIVREYNTSTGIEDNIGINAFKGKDQVLWILGNKGIHRVLHNYAIDAYDEFSNLDGPVYYVNEFEDKLMIGSASGIQQMGKDGKFHYITDQKGQSWLGKEATSISTFFSILGAKVVGIRKGKIIFETSKRAEYVFEISHLKKNTLYVPRDHFLDEYNFTKSTIELISSKKFPFVIREFYEVDTNKFVFATEEKAIGVAKFNESDTITYTLFDTTYGLAEKDGNELAAFIEDKLFIIQSDNKLFQINWEDNTLMPFDIEKRFGIRNKKIINGHQNKKGEFSFQTADNSITWVKDLPSGKPLVDSISFNILNEGVFINSDAHHFSPSGNLYIGTSDKLYRFNPRNYWNFQQNWHTEITSITIGRDSSIFSGFHYSKNKDGLVMAEKQANIPILSYDLNNLKFQFEGIDFVAPERLDYSFKLEGFDNEWSEWSDISSKEYTNLHEGAYSFQVKAKNVFDKESQIANYSFTIEPPIYRTIWAYLLYLIGAIVIVRTAIKINERRLKKENELLEQTVKERTAEIEQQKEELQAQAENLSEMNEELSQQKEEIQQQADELNSTNELLANINNTLEQRNKSILDSITYAKRIQDAILPTADKLKKSLGDNFVFYKPKDIVGGDFYWTHKDDNAIYWAVIDCTGHGVPGGFMSMIGHAILNEIVSEKHITEVDKILDLMRERVIRSINGGLMHDLIEAERKDGMDIALCKWNIDSKTLEFAGANLDCYVIRNGELIEIAGDKQPIGVYKMMRPFIKHSLDLEIDDTIYLFTDGYVDQFGGTKKRKFKYRRMRELLKRLSVKPIEQQLGYTVQIFNKWKGEESQTDDVTLMGIKIK